MCEQLIKAMDFTLENFIPEPSFSLHTTEEYLSNIQPDNMFGMSFPKTNVEQIKEDLKKLV
jgi:hypothetical protein